MITRPTSLRRHDKEHDRRSWEDSMKRHLRRWAAGIGAAVLGSGLLTGAADAADKKFKIFLSHELYRQRLAGRGRQHGQGHGGAQGLRRQGRPAGPGRRPERPAPDPADQRHGAAGRPGDRRLSDLADGAERRGQERLRQGRDDHRLRRRDHRALRLQRLDRPGRGRTRDRRVAGQEAQRQGQHRR